MSRPRQQPLPDLVLSEDQESLVRILARANGIDPDRPAQRYAIWSIYRKEIDAIIEAEWEPESATALRDRMADLLTRTANALKGDPSQIGPHGGMHDWSDLPEVAEEKAR